MKSRAPTKERANPKQQSLPLPSASITASGMAGQALVVAALARLLLEAAKAAVRKEAADDAS